MKKGILLLAVLLLMIGVKAQTIAEGIKHLDADRYVKAESVFKNLVAAQPKNTEAIYWLGQVYFNMDDNAKAKALYQDAITKNGNSPLLQVGIGHALLLENKATEAKQQFESALTMSHTKKGDDPMIQTAIGRAIVDIKKGDYAYAIKLLESATASNPQNTETLLQLGNAWRKASPGTGGGEAFAYYKKALEINPSYAVADLRIAKIFETQKNWVMMLEFLNSAVKRDPNFAPGYYELFYYYFERADFTQAEDFLKKYIASSDGEYTNDFLYAQLCWAKKDYDCAIAKGEALLTAAGSSAKAKYYKLLAYAYLDKGNYPAAAKNADLFFQKAKPEEIIAQDYILKADILVKQNAPENDILQAYVQAAGADTAVYKKIELFKKGAAYFKANKLRASEVRLLEMILALKPKPSINDYFDLTVASYFINDYTKSRDNALLMRTSFPDQVFGYEWAFNNSRITDTLRKDSIAVPDALLLTGFAEKDTQKYKKQYLASVKFLAEYYTNTARNKDKALEYFRKWLQADPENAEVIKGYISQLEKLNIKKPRPMP
jgi:Tfp pilus assembly protein PilF